MLPQSETDTLSDWYLLGGRYYELTNHLGNVLSVITDKKIGVSSGGSTVDYYRAEVLSQHDYYPFGMEQPGRSYNGIPYPYAFNGKRMENVELFTTNIYDYGMRNYDARTGRFYSVDPLTGKYPELTPYQFASNTPIQAIDLDGLEKYIVTARSFIPMKTLDNPWYTPNFTSYSFKGDDRYYYTVGKTSYRTEQKVNINFDNKTVTYSNNTASGSTGYDSKGNIDETSDPTTAGTIKYDKTALKKGTATTIYLKVNASNKLVHGAPAINYDLAITVTPSKDKKSFKYQIKGESDGFPAYELWITDKTNKKSYLLFNRTPTKTGETPIALFPPMEHSYNLKGNSTNITPSTKNSFSNTPNSP